MLKSNTPRLGEVGEREALGEGSLERLLLTPPDLTVEPQSVLDRLEELTLERRQTDSVLLGLRVAELPVLLLR